MADSFQPYVGPRPFERRHHGVFFGREYETEELLSLVVAHDVVLLYAQSGAGKTSLVNAGLIPRLEDEGAEVLPVARVGSRLPAGLDAGAPANVYVFNTLVSWTGGKADWKSLSETSLAAFLAARERAAPRDGLPTPRVAIFDQFEELFSSRPDRWADREGFFKQVLEARDGFSRQRMHRGDSQPGGGRPGGRARHPI